MKDQNDSRKESQIDKFKEAARMAGADESEAPWEARLKKIATPKEKKVST